MLIRLVFAMSVAAVLLMAVYLYSIDIDEADVKATPLNVDLRVVLGQSIERDGVRLAVPTADGRVILSGQNQVIDADKFRFLRVSLSHVDMVKDVEFFWRSASDAGSIKTLLLPINADGRMIYLGAENDWVGDITEIGLIIYGRQDARIGMASLQFMPPSIFRMMLTEFNEWIMVWRWDQRTINFLRWDGLNINPVPVVTGWLLTAFLIYSIFAKERRKKAAVILILSGWIVLDLRWYWEQYHQVTDLRSQLVEFQDEVVLPHDFDLYAEIVRLKRDVLPKEPVRMQIAKSGAVDEYVRLKAQYYLLPHAVYGFGSEPILDELQSGDWLWAMGATPYSAYADLEKRHNDQDSLSVIKMDQGPFGAIYKIL